MDYVAFLVVNAVIFLRPAEIVPELGQVPFYYFAMLACFACSIVPLLNLTFSSPLKWHPTVIFSFAMFFLSAVSLAINRDLGNAFDEQFEFVKVIAYFVLFLAIIRTPQRLQGVIACVVLCMMATAALGILHFYEVIELPNLKQMEESLQYRYDWSQDTIRRLRFTGLMDGPNEVAVFLSVLTFLCGYQFNNKKMGFARFFWLVPIGLFLSSVFLTRSRGGLLALLAGLVVFMVYAYRQANAPTLAAGAAPRKSPILGILVLACVIPVLLLAGGRQTEISTDTNTAQTRFGTWSDWLVEFRNNPIIGIGPRLGPRADRGHAAGLEDRLLAHNSFLQPFADLGFAGGLCFLGAVGFCFVTLGRYGPNKTIILDADLARLHPYLMAALVCCSVGFLTLSINYLIPVFFVLAIPVAYYGMTPCFPPIKAPALTFAAVVWLVVASIGFLAMMYAVVRVMPKQ